MLADKGVSSLYSHALVFTFFSLLTFFYLLQIVLETLDLALDFKRTPRYARVEKSGIINKK